MSWAAVGSAAISVAGSVASSQMGKQKAPKGAAPANIDIAAESRKALEFNRANLGEIQSMTSESARADQQIAMEALEMIMPGFAEISRMTMKAAATDMEGSMTGRMSPEFEAEILRNASSNNIATGARGQAGDFNVARNLGIGALDYQNMLRKRSLTTLSQLSGMSPRINPLSTTAMMLTPSHAIAVQSGNEQARYNAQQSMFNAQAAAGNTNAGIDASMIQSLAGSVGSFWGTYSDSKLNPPKT